MSDKKIELLVVDDEAFNRDILNELLTSAGYQVAEAVDGEDAWAALNAQPDRFSAILLDRMMPRLDGMELLGRIKQDVRFSDLPVIFQTAIDRPEDIAEGISAGAFYYLTKPLDEKVLFAIVQSAVNTFRMSGEMRQAENQEQAILARTLVRNEFHFRTLTEARTLASVLSYYFPHPQRVYLGLSELLINAVEHGNLAITYQEKSRLLQDGKWEAEIERRLALPEYSGKKVRVKLEHLPAEIRVDIEDDGNGFDCAGYMQMSAERAFDPNGRGIAMSRMTSFDTLEYLGKGNRLTASVKTT